MALKKLGNDYNVKVREHGFLNECQGMIHCHDAKYMTEEEIIEGLTDQKQKVVKVFKIRKMINGVLVDTPLCILTFKSSQLPEKIKFGFHSCIVTRYIPSPMKCKNCFRYGHSKKFCTRETLCVLCSKPVHEPNPCVDPKIACVNCPEVHDN